MGAEDQGVEGRGPRIRAEGRGSRNTNTFLLMYIYSKATKIQVKIV